MDTAGKPQQEGTGRGILPDRDIRQRPFLSLAPFEATFWKSFFNELIADGFAHDVDKVSIGTGALASVSRRTEALK